MKGIVASRYPWIPKTPGPKPPIDHSLNAERRKNGPVHHGGQQTLQITHAPIMVACLENRVMMERFRNYLRKLDFHETNNGTFNGQNIGLSMDKT